MKIGELAKKSGIATETIRYYEQQKLIPEPMRTDNNYRIYSEKHLERLIFIRNCRAFDMAHEEIHQLIAQMDAPNTGCQTINQIVHTHLEHIDVRIAELTALKNKLASLQNTCAEDHSVNQCTLLKGLASMDVHVRKHTHLG